MDSAELFDNAKADGNSTIRNFAKLFGDVQVLSSIVQMHARIGEAAFVSNCTVSGTADIRGYAIIEDSYIGGNAVISGHPEITSCNLQGNVRVADKAKLTNVITGNEDINDTFVIEGEAVLDFPIPMPLAPGTRVHEGIWTRPPLVIHTPFFSTVEGVHDRVSIGCASHSMNFWFRDGLKVLQRYGLPAEYYQEFYRAMVAMRDFKSKTPSPKKVKKK